MNKPLCIEIRTTVGTIITSDNKQTAGDFVETYAGARRGMLLKTSPNTELADGLMNQQLSDSERNKRQCQSS